MAIYWFIVKSLDKSSFSTLRKRLLTHPGGQNDRHFADDIFRCIFMNERFCILIKNSLKFVLKGQIDNNPALI